MGATPSLFINPGRLPSDLRFFRTARWWGQPAAFPQQAALFLVFDPLPPGGGGVAFRYEGPRPRVPGPSGPCPGFRQWLVRRPPLPLRVRAGGKLITMETTINGSRVFPFSVYILKLANHFIVFFYI